MLVPTPPDKLSDSHGRPYFLWDCDVTLPALRVLLSSDDAEVRAYWMAKVMRQAKPDDALTFIRARDMRASWEMLERLLGDKRAFWRWLLENLPR